MTEIPVPRPPRPEGHQCGNLLATFVHLRLARPETGRSLRGLMRPLPKTVESRAQGGPR